MQIFEKKFFARPFCLIPPLPMPLTERHFAYFLSLLGASEFGRGRLLPGRVALVATGAQGVRRSATDQVKRLDCESYGSSTNLRNSKPLRNINSEEPIICSYNLLPSLRSAFLPMAAVPSQPHRQAP